MKTCKALKTKVSVKNSELGCILTLATLGLIYAGENPLTNFWKGKNSVRTVHDCAAALFTL